MEEKTFAPIPLIAKDDKTRLEVLAEACRIGNYVLFDEICRQMHLSCPGQDEADKTRRFVRLLTQGGKDGLLALALESSQDMTPARAKILASILSGFRMEFSNFRVDARVPYDQVLADNNVIESIYDGDVPDAVRRKVAAALRALAYRGPLGEANDNKAISHRLMEREENLFQRLQAACRAGDEARFDEMLQEITAGDPETAQGKRDVLLLHFRDDSLQHILFEAACFGGNAGIIRRVAMAYDSAAEYMRHVGDEEGESTLFPDPSRAMVYALGSGHAEAVDAVAESYGRWQNKGPVDLAMAALIGAASVSDKPEALTQAVNMFAKAAQKGTRALASVHTALEEARNAPAEEKAETLQVVLRHIEEEHLVLSPKDAMFARLMRNVALQEAINTLKEKNEEQDVAAADEQLEAALKAQSEAEIDQFSPECLVKEALEDNTAAVFITACVRGKAVVPELLQLYELVDADLENAVSFAKHNAVAKEALSAVCEDKANGLSDALRKRLSNALEAIAEKSPSSVGVTPHEVGLAVAAEPGGERTP